MSQTCPCLGRSQHQGRGNDVRFGICGKRRICGCGEQPAFFAKLRRASCRQRFDRTKCNTQQARRLAVAGLYPVPTGPLAARRAGSDPPLRPTAKIRFLTRDDVTRSQPHPGPSTWHTGGGSACQVRSARLRPPPLNPGGDPGMQVPAEPWQPWQLAQPQPKSTTAFIPVCTHKRK